MSIVPLERATFIGMGSNKERLLDDLHEMGCLELIPLREQGREVAAEGPSSASREALKFLLSCPQRRRQVSDDGRFDAHEVEHRVLELQDRLHRLTAERDDLLTRLQAAKPWGDFQFSPIEQNGGLRLWFYAIPHKDMIKLAERDHVWEVIRRDPQFYYVVVPSPTEPEAMPVPRTHIGSRSPKELGSRLEEVELAIEDAQAERAFLTRWCLLFARDLSRLEDTAARKAAAGLTCDLAPIFALEAWVPQEYVDRLTEYSDQNGIVFSHRPPTSEEDSPTLMRNAPRVEAGEDLVSFYMTPGYRTWDPSRIVLISFAIFFAMIMADAGYAAVLGLALLVFWRRLNRSESGRRYRPMLLLIVSASLVFGVLVGSYFGVTPSADSFAGRLHLLDMNNSRMMMGLSVLVGGVHVILANVMDARRYPDWRDGLASIGWATVITGGLLFATGAAVSAVSLLKPIGGGAVFAGLLLVIWYTAAHERPVKRVAHGMLGLTKISAAFGDILSYLRLFALGLASASLAIAFNDMAAGIRTSMPRFGLVLALLVLAFGHALNLLLCISSGVIHGLRLNVIEFFNWGLKEEGRRFTPFRRKEGTLWK